MKYPGVKLRSDNITVKPQHFDPTAKPKKTIFHAPRRTQITKEEKLYVANVQQYHANRHRNAYSS